MRIAKFLSRSGICSRREAKEIIESGKISVNSKVITELNFQIQPQDEVKYLNQKIAIEATKIWLFYKPKYCLTCKRDSSERQNIYDFLGREYQHLMPIGRLDFNSEGLLLMTNDGEVKREFELPKNEIERIYKVRISGSLNFSEKKLLERGIEIAGIRYRPMKIRNLIERNNSWLEMRLFEGKNREIRKVMEHFGHQVSRLIRISYGEYHLADLKPGEIIEAMI